jgi:hypothetical protein
LRNIHPLMRNFACDFKRRVGNVATLGDDLAEFCRTTGNYTTFGGLAIFPQSARWRGQAHSRHLARWLEATIFPCEAPRVHAKAYDISNPVSVLPFHAKHIVYGLPMCPSFH